VAFEDLGLLAPIMEREGWNVSFCEAAVDDLAHRSIKNADLVIVLGGPTSVYETDDYPFLTSEIALIEYRLSRDLPTLGILPRQPAHGQRTWQPRIQGPRQGNRLGYG
jgi:GMP synthase (glutamine-hydrolysing)